jgi:hypothetical protein
MVWAPWPSTYLSTIHFTLSPEISSLHSSNPCSCCSCSQFRSPCSAHLCY